jgi:rhodanese-related sulfurtransferase
LDFLLNHIFLIALVMISGLFLIFPKIVSGGIGKTITSKNSVLMMNRQPSFLIDVRGEQDFNSGHLQNATNIKLEEIPDKIGVIKKHSKKLIIVYCQKGIRSEQAVNMLVKLGLDNVVSIEGGINAWIKEQLPIANR